MVVCVSSSRVPVAWIAIRDVWGTAIYMASCFLFLEYYLLLVFLVTKQLNSLTPICGHDRQLFNELCACVASPQIFVRW